MASDLTWTKHVGDRSSKANQLLGFLRRSAAEIKSYRTRRTLYLAVVRPLLGYATQIWAPQYIELMKRVERVQRRATKFILGLPFMCDESYQERLIRADLLPLSYWHEYLDLTFFFKAVTGLVYVSSDVLPQPLIPSRVTRSTSNSNTLLFRPRKCKSVTFQRSYFNRVTRVWNTLPEEIRQRHMTLSRFKNMLQKYYFKSVVTNFSADDVRTWKTICSKCNTARTLSGSLTCCA